MQNPPQVTPRITPKMTKDGPYLGPGVQMPQKLRLLISLGIFGEGATKQTIGRLVYQTHTKQILEMDPDLGEPVFVDQIDDATALNRMDSLYRNGKTQGSFIQEELDFLRQGFEFFAGNNAMSLITDEMLRTGTLLQILKCLSGGEIKMDWAHLDPLLALEVLTTDLSPLNIELVFADQKRWIDHDEAPELGENEQPEQNFIQLTPKGKFRLHIERDQAPSAPFLFEVMHRHETFTVQGQPIRAQRLPEAKRMDEGHGPWRISDRLNKPFTATSKPGRFTVFALLGMGTSTEFLFGEYLKDAALNNAHLCHLVNRLIEAKETNVSLSMGTLTYEVCVIS